MDDKLQLLGNINYMKYTHIKRGIARQTFEVRCNKLLPELIFKKRALISQDFGRLLMDVLGAKGIASDDLDSWKGVLTVFVNGVSPKN
jgi:hypothetical protein